MSPCDEESGMAISRDEVAGRRRAYWQEILGRWRASELSQAQFCRRRGIPVWKFAWWKKRLAAERVAPGSSFVPVQVVASSPAEELELVLRGGRVLRFGAGMDPARLTAIVAAVEAVAPALAEGAAC
jgi:hypothetical protein